MPKTAPQLFRFKNKELRSRKGQEKPTTEHKKSAVVQSGKPVNFGPGWDKKVRAETEHKWKQNKSRTPRSPYMTQRGAQNLDKRREISMTKAKEIQQDVVQEEKEVKVEVPVPVVEGQKTALSKLADMAGSSLNLVASGITG